MLRRSPILCLRARQATPATTQARSASRALTALRADGRGVHLGALPSVGVAMDIPGMLTVVAAMETSNSPDAKPSRALRSSKNTDDCVNTTNGCTARMGGVIAVPLAATWFAPGAAAPSASGMIRNSSSASGAPTRSSCVAAAEAGQLYAAALDEDDDGAAVARTNQLVRAESAGGAEPSGLLPAWADWASLVLAPALGAMADDTSLECCFDASATSESEVSGSPLTSLLWASSNQQRRVGATVGANKSLGGGWGTNKERGGGVPSAATRMGLSRASSPSVGRLAAVSVALADLGIIPPQAPGTRPTAQACALHATQLAFIATSLATRFPMTVNHVQTAIPPMHAWVAQLHASFFAAASPLASSTADEDAVKVAALVRAVAAVLEAFRESSGLATPSPLAVAQWMRVYGAARVVAPLPWATPAVSGNGNRPAGGGGGPPAAPSLTEAPDATVWWHGLAPVLSPLRLHRRCAGFGAALSWAVCDDKGAENGAGISPRKGGRAPGSACFAALNDVHCCHRLHRVRGNTDPVAIRAVVGAEEGCPTMVLFGAASRRRRADVCGPELMLMATHLEP